jgi:hypothetical protein
VAELSQLKQLNLGTELDRTVRVWPSTMMPAPALANTVHRQQCLDQAARCRRLAYSLSDRQAAEQLLAMAADYERNAWASRQG